MAFPDGGSRRDSSLAPPEARTAPPVKLVTQSSHGVSHMLLSPPARALPAITAVVAAPAATVTAAPTALNSVAAERYRAKLEECAALHREIGELMQTNETVEQRLASSQAEAALLRHAVHRLESVLQLRNEELVVMRESRRQQYVSTGEAATAESRLMLQPPASSLTAPGGGTVAAAAAAVAASRDPAAAVADQSVLLEYINVSCYLGCPTHPQLIQSFFAATTGEEALVATEPPLTYAQGAVLHRLLARPPTGAGVAAAAAAASELFAFRGWAAEHLCTLSIAFEDTYAGISVIADVLMHSVPSLVNLELRRVNSDAAVVKLADALIGATQVRALSLPELAVADEGLQALWRLLRTRASMRMPDVSVAPHGAGAATVEVRTLDLSACLLHDGITLAQLYCPTAEVLLLPPTDRLTDSLLADVLQRCSRLHTLDLSGCVRLTDACVDSINTAAPQLRVLALEHCPHIHRLRLDHVEVLLSSLVHVHVLESDSLRVLPLPVQQRTVLLSLAAPSLTHISLHGLLVDAELLRRLDGRVRLTSLTFSECTFAGDDVLTRLLAPQTDLVQLRLYHCKGLSGACWTAAGSTTAGGGGGPLTFSALTALELVNMRTLTDAALLALVQACPALQQLNLHGAGWTHLTDISIRRLDQLADLRVLNLLALNPDLVTAPVVTAVARRLPQLQRLYHETAFTAGAAVSAGEPGATEHASVPASVSVERSDAEARWRAALRDYPLRLLRLQHHSALPLWTDGAAAANAAVAVTHTSAGEAAAAAESKFNEPSKLFPAMASRTMAAAVAASAAAATTTTLAPMPHTAFAPHEMSIGAASTRRDTRSAAAAAAAAAAAPASPPPLSAGSGEPQAADSPLLSQTAAQQRQQPHLRERRLSSSCSSSSSSDRGASPTRDGGVEAAASRGTKRSLVQCANAAAAVAPVAPPFQRRSTARSTGAARPSVSAAVAAAAAAAQARAVDDVEEPSVGPWEE
ncbi:leucine-rich repeat protein [Novymonas esmeraldas]|uniref:Leucine-rich repeat protein n=1 Tax=Novymonas esmeraldas TaxID=1808958 RepID=A0AAW0EVD0_9TRYP